MMPSIGLTLCFWIIYDLAYIEHLALKTVYDRILHE